MIFDSHAHYNDERFSEDYKELLSTMQDNNVGLIMNSCSEISEIPDILKICREFDFIYASVGVHPHEVSKMKDSDLQVLRDYSKNKKVKAIGEIGLDYYYDNSPRDIQKLWFDKQINLATELDLPIVVHDRDAHGDCMDILRRYKGTVKGEFHCFQGSVEMAKEVLNMGMYIAFGGSLTFKNARRAIEVLKYVPMDRVLLETDCPYLTPVPHRGKRNDSTYIKYVVSMISEIKGIAEAEVEDITFNNAKEMFKIK